MRNRILLTTSVLAILLPLSTWIGCAASSGGTNMMEEEEQVVVITTDKGEIVIELYSDAAPATVDNFKTLIKKKFYDWLTFHRRVDQPGLNIIQGGDPEGDGTGGPEYTIIDEHTNPNQAPHQRGTIAMANTGNPNSAGSQFYICLIAQPHLDGRYTTFGQVIQGMEVVDLLRVGDEMKKVRLEAKSKYVIPEQEPTSYIERFIVIFLAALFTVYLVSCSQEQKGPPKPKARPTASAETMQAAKSTLDIHNAMAVIETDKGAIEVEFFADVAPKTVENFLKNARLEYYNHATFHRVEPGELIQAGSRFPIEDTIAIEASDHKPVRGILAMAKEEGATVADATQFFICLDTLILDSDYTLFGQVTKGLDVIDSIAVGDQIMTIKVREKG